ncbi:hypothetical protein ACIQUF_08265 [Pseudomonas sp. NPDC090233]|uniref:hypothetical protein n=1 Tax=Pseudomonas sp. NPDC090233 TaxID=3364479 RepID=UPI00383A4C80
MSKTAKPEDMPILDLDLTHTKPFEAYRFLDHPVTISVFLAEAMADQNTQILKIALGELAKAKGLHQDG